ncbi:HTH-type transcriptional regulator GltC [bioreactor metagenome]|uniref:HTH-type transcriptional regulator GltC n=1 Tax=bioreactor metagenome TaxID=1076179 RepID=A0A644SVK7_9ZZZZ|nr:LysR family transcriptional regulator [Negativicutes bacterium]
MDIRHLEYFSEVARQRSFTKAAEVLHITQPTISKMIKTLEEELGVTLISRAAKQIELTDAGQAVFSQAQHVLSAFHNLTSELSDVMNIKRGLIRIGLPPIASSSIFPRVMGEFNKVYPEINLELIEVGSKMVERGVEDGTLDIGVVCNLPNKEGIFEMFSFIKDPLMVIVHPDNPLAKQKQVDFTELKDESFVLYRNDFSLHDHIVARCIKSGFQPKVVCGSSQRDFMTEAVAAGLGIALLPQKICQELDSSRVKAIPLIEPSVYLQLAVIWKKDKYLSFAAREWLKFTSSLLNIELPERVKKHLQ